MSQGLTHDVTEVVVDTSICFNPFKPSDVNWLHFRVFGAIGLLVYSTLFDLFTTREPILQLNQLYSCPLQI